MSEFVPAIATDIVATCHSNAAEIAAAFEAGFGEPLQVVPGECTSFDPSATPPELAGPGLLCVFRVGSSAAMLLMPAASGLLPAWHAAPDPNGSQRLATMALELGTLLLPISFVPDAAQAAAVGQLADVLSRAGVAPGAGVLPLNASNGSQQGTLWLLWPATRPADIFANSSEVTHSRGAGHGSAADHAAFASVHKEARRAVELRDQLSGKHRNLDEELRRLPPYSRSLLKIPVSLVVTLAETKQPVSKILELVPGAIIKFHKTCEEMLTLEMGSQTIATGEAVKIGDKFGLRLTAIELPDERFTPVRRT